MSRPEAEYDGQSSFASFTCRLDRDRLTEEATSAGEPLRAFGDGITLNIDAVGGAFSGWTEGSPSSKTRTRLTTIRAQTDLDPPICAPMVHEDFDRYEGGFLTIASGVDDSRLSFQRRFLRDEGGRTILQNANTSATDFILADFTPGAPPAP